MRILRPLATLGAFLVAALLAGCAASQTSQSLPAQSSATNQIALLKSATSPSRLLELQADGRLPGPVPAARLRDQLTRRHNRPNFAAHKAAGTIAIWATDTNFNYLLGQTANGRSTITAVDLSQNSCLSPVGVKVDAAQNAWVSCELTSDSGTNGALQEFSPAGQLQKQYLPACPASVQHCDSFSGYGWDSGLDAKGDVFASLNLYSIETCNPSCDSNLGAGFEWWPKGKPTAKPHLITLGDNCSPICGVGFMDIDASGDIWFTFSGYAGSTYGFGLGEIASPTKDPTLTIVEPIGTYGFFGGVNVSQGGATLNVLDQQARTISQYHLPLSASGTPFNVLGPTPQNAFAVGDPVSGGFNKGDSKIALADTGGWLDLGTVSNNKWTSVASPNFYSGIEGAAYTPSDK
jgi:hypothetical protein